MTHRPLVVLSFLAALIAPAAHAVGTTGELTGIVTTVAGASLAGARVTATSPSQIGGELPAITDDGGRFRYPRLAPGNYVVRVTAAGHESSELRDVQVRLDHVTQAQVRLAPAAYQETMVVPTTPIIDPATTSLGQTFTRDYIREVRQPWQDLIASVPGATTTAGAGLYGQRILGSPAEDNTYRVDGIDYTDWTGKQVVKAAELIPFDALQEVNVRAAGFDAATGLATGGVVELATRSGGNRFTGSFDGKYTDSTMERSGRHYDPADSRHRKIAATLGGPLLRDRLWFFTSFANYYDRYPTQGAPTDAIYDFDNDLQKLTWQATPAWLVAAERVSSPQRWDAFDWQPGHSAETVGYSHDFSHTTSLDATDTFSAHGYWSTRVAHRGFGWRYKPKGVGLETISHFNRDTGETTGSLGFQERNLSNQDELATEVDLFVQRRGDHELRLGGQVARPSVNRESCWTGSGTCQAGIDQFHFVDVRGAGGGSAPYQMDVQPASAPFRYHGRLASLFVEDRWRPWPRLTLAFGLREDQVRYENRFGGAGKLAELQPRVGAAWQPTGDGRTVARGSWGRYMHPGSALLASIGGAQSWRIESWLSCSALLSTDAQECERQALAAGYGYRHDPDGWDPAGWFLRPDSVSGSSGALPKVDPELEPAVQTQWLLGIEREVFRRTAVELSYVHKSLGNLYNTTCNGNVPTPHAGAACDYLVVTNVPEYRWDYHGWILRLETRAWERVHLLASWTMASAKGAAQFGTGIMRDFDVFPLSWQNRYGYAFDQTRHRVKLDGYVRFPHEVSLALHGWWQSDYRWSDIVFRAPAGQVYDSPRGNHSGPGGQNLDLQLGKGFAVHGTRLSLLGAVYNVFDNESPLQGCNFVSGCSPTTPHGGTTSFTQPRRYEAGVRLEF